MIQSSKDILFLILGISILAVSFFICLLLYYLVKLVRKFYKTGKFLEKISEKINEIIETVGKKVKEITLIPLISEAIKTVIDFLKEKKKEKEKKEKE
ncbi:MAG: hypothetical protein ACK413_02140 [Patescibacteria group bacterium]